MGAIDDGSASYIIKKILSGVSNAATTGVPPRNMSNYSVSAGNQQATVKCTPPENTVIDDQLICTVAGVKVVRKATSAPANPDDGTLVADVKVGQSLNVQDTGLTNGVTYYYGFFPYSDHGVFNLNGANIKSTTPSAIKYWAFDQDFSNGDPDQTITYPVGFQNSAFAKMLTNEGTGTATAGDWADFLEKTLKNYPAMVDIDGRMVKQLDPDDYTKYLDGTAAPYNVSTYYAGAWINKIWVHEEYSSNGESREVQFADGPADGFVPLGFTDPNGDELSGIWLPMGYMDANGKTVISGTTPVAAKTCDQEKALITGFSSRGVFLGGAILNLLRDLEYMLFKSTDIQKQAGHGRCNAGSQAVIANAVVANGAVRGWKGTASATKALNKYFHSQVLGSYQQWLRDPYTQLVAGRMYVEPNYVYNITNTTGKVDTGITWPTDSAWNYPKHLQESGDATFGSVPKHENTGTTATGLCDGVYGNASGTRVGIRLGTCGHDLADGPATLFLDYEASVAAWYSGVGLMLLPPSGYEPDLEEVV